MNSIDLTEIRVAAAARLFALVALTVPVVLAGDVVPLVGLVILAAVWMTGLAFRGFKLVPPLLLITFEAIAVGVTIGAALDHAQPLLGALVVAPLMGGVRAGVRGVMQTLAAEGLALAVTLVRLGQSVSGDVAGSMTSWLVAALGFGFIASFVRSRQLTAESSDVTPYRDARQLIGNLLDLSGQLSNGLDAVSISERVMATAREELPFLGSVVYVRRDGVYTPLLDSAENAGLDTPDRERLVSHTWDSGTPSSTPTEVAFPLITDAGVVAVVAGGLPSTLNLTPDQVHNTLRGLSHRLRTEALQLDTALLFSAVRDAATAEERRRLAREVHDGVAQDVASLGYVVDELEELASTEEQREVFARLRAEITSVVAELRRSVFSLRNESTHAGSLGESIGALARHVTTVTGIPVHLSLDESTQRLRIEVESELLRIAQEAMNNAVRHAHPDNIWVECFVKAPEAHVSVRDDGPGLGPGRHDSHGLRIMRERAALLGARIDIRDAEPHGTVVQVRVERAPSPQATAQSGRVPS